MARQSGLKEAKPIAYQLRPTPQTPNSSYPLLHYPGLVDTSQLSPSKASKIFEDNGWETQWVIRYATSQRAHYHSKTHETMVILNGRARVRFGASDLTATEDPAADHENGGVEIDTKPGDVFVIPAGVSHKTFNATPEMPFEILTPGEGRGVGGVDLDEIDVSGFVMLGAYPKGGQWDFCVGGEGKEEVGLPMRDPVLGESSDGLRGIWK
ncbi:uncharacterized protein BDZ99DRAFT_572573 [Mytilinidion resinicola]|uniref:Cupin type-1 domain-containing protein n=1 Tax=Mytilinidion resinicola TaxID=574789 RepID=A0A6A6YI47_9PEZI|nr:uncharacterized protein BDZ99DRAFT_572573 [Mytilinidion resinicola]KAF2807664.1 hypothetical protein BDZ99DRAFT_572573 [Mytilinidion resinicola]